jgi:hypothetical protein
MNWYWVVLAHKSGNAHYCKFYKTTRGLKSAKKHLRKQCEGTPWRLVHCHLDGWHEEL